MRILLINPPYHSLTSLYGVGAQTPLGLLWIGGALIDAGYEVTWWIRGPAFDRR